MSKLMVGGVRFLFLCAVLLASSILTFSDIAFAQQSTVAINPVQGPAGTTLTGTGTNWRAGDRMQITWEGATVLANTNVHSDGTFSTSFNVPANATAGAHNIYFTDLDSRYFLVAIFTVTAVQNQVAPKIVRVETFVEGVLVFFRLFFTDPSSIAVGFGFKGLNGSGWAEENHPFTSPSFGRVFPGIVEYPFNHLCGQPEQFESDVEAWIYDTAGRRTPSVTIHLACEDTSLVADLFTYPMDLAQRTGVIDYDFNNPGLTRQSQCYGVPLSQAWHAGEDWFASADSPVNAVANGVVRYSSKPESGGTTTYPGGVVIIEHRLPDGSHIYSMYAHLDPSKILVAKEAKVAEGQKIADGLCNTGACAGNVHLHWEMRFFFDGSGINKATTEPPYTQTCSEEPAPGYTYPGRPDNFVANGGRGPTYRWTDPSDFVNTH
jgi:hypothetical protein